jgi:hypothetical protein
MASEEPYAATQANVDMLREEVAELLRAAIREPRRASAYRKRAAEVDQLADRLERRLRER